MTTVAIEGFASRADIGLRRPDSISRNVNPAAGGVAWHYLGFNPRISTHSDCLRVWRNVQKSHMDTNGWVDIAYTLGVCPHGWVLAGRGYGVRTAAQGTNDGNSRFMAACALTDGPTTSKMIAAMLWATAEMRRDGAGREVRPHSHFRSTSCPGDPLRAETARWHNNTINQTVEEEDMSVLDWAKESWNKMLDRARVSENTHARNVDRQELSYIMDEFGLLDLDPATVKFLVRMKRYVDEEDSSPAFARESVRDTRRLRDLRTELREHVDDHPGGVGLSPAELDRLRIVKEDG